jgi:hypothetical protein
MKVFFTKVAKYFINNIKPIYGIATLYQMIPTLTSFKSQNRISICPLNLIKLFFSNLLRENVCFFTKTAKYFVKNTKQIQGIHGIAIFIPPDTYSYFI